MSCGRHFSTYFIVCMNKHIWIVPPTSMPTVFCFSEIYLKHAYCNFQSYNYSVVYTGLNFSYIGGRIKSKGIRVSNT